MDWPAAGVIITAILGCAAPLTASLLRRNGRPSSGKSGCECNHDTKLAVLETRFTALERQLTDFILVERRYWKQLFGQLDIRGFRSEREEPCDDSR